MNSVRSLVSLLVVAVAVVAVVGGAAGAPTPSVASPPAETADLGHSLPMPANNSTAVDLNESHLPSPPAVGAQSVGAASPSTVIVEAADDDALNVSRLRAHAAAVGPRYDRYVEVDANPAAVRAIENVSWVRAVRPAPRAVPMDAAGGVKSMRAGSVQTANITGEGVKVGVITLGVDPTAAAYADQVAATKAFHSAGIEGADATHGTGVTEVVSETAPNASLYLTTFESGVDYANAASWLVDRDVDVVVMSAGFYATPDDGSSLVSQVATDVTDRGVFWANSAGNAAQTHWRGAFDNPDGDSWLNFGGETEANYLNDGELMARGTPVRLHLTWDDYPETDDRYALYLLDSERQVVAQSSPVAADRPAETLAATLPRDGRYFFAVAGPESDHTLSAVGSGGTDRFQYGDPEGSILAPSVAPGVTAVGAYHVGTDEVAPYSSVGRTADGRRGLDVTAPSGVVTDTYDGRFYGTSAAAPHVGGAAALLRSLNRSASAAELERALLRSADDLGRPGVDIYTGAGRVNVTAAAERLDPTVPLAVAANESRIVAGDRVEYAVTRFDTGAPVAAAVTVGNRTVETGPDGTVAVEYESAGTYDLSVRALADPLTADFEATTGTETVRAATEAEPTVSVSPSNVTAGEQTTVTVAVSDAGRAVENATVSLTGSGVDTTAVTGADGTAPVAIAPTTAGSVEAVATVNGSSTASTTLTVTAAGADEEHESGVSNRTFGAVAGDDGDLGRIDVLQAVRRYIGDRPVDGVGLDRTDVVTLVGYYITR